MINLFTDISYKNLYKRLLSLLTASRKNVFSETWIVVPNHSAKQWLQRSLAKDLGICARIKFIMPLSFNWEVLKNASDTDTDNGNIANNGINVFSQDVLRWLIFEIISTQKQYRHLKKDSDIKNFNLAEKIAQTLLKYNDEYPEIIAKWDEGIYELPHEVEWQVELWLTLLEKLKTKSQVQLLQQFDSEKDFKQTPEKIIFFATEQLTELQKETLLKLAQTQEITMMLSNPCPQDYWFDIKPAANKARAALFNTQAADIIDVGNPILANLGYNKMAIFDAFLNHEVYLQESNSAIQGKSLLQSLKQDIYSLQKQPSMCADDDSISIHSCHSRQREVEIIKDEILAHLDADLGLNPEDIIVVAPDINDYVQSIKEVFEHQALKVSKASKISKDSIYLPFHIDRVQLADAPYITALMKLLSSFTAEMSAPVIYELLTQNSILQKFNIDENELPRLKNWITSSNIRNYFSAQHKSTLGYEEKIGNTWQFGKNRWISGYLLGDEEEQYLSTYGDIAGQEELFSRCFDFLNLWYKCYQFTQGQHSPKRWYSFLQDLCEDFLYNDFSVSWQEKILIQLENKFAAQPLDCSQSIPLVIVESIVKSVITENTFRSEGQIGVRFQTWENAFVTDGKLLIMMGLNDGEFPKKSIKNDLDIFSDKPAKLNKSTRQRDKNLMLTALTENAQKLIFTYIGFDSKTNDEQPPSVILAELIGYLKQKTKQDFKVKVHKMHGYNQYYFLNELRSYSQKNHQLARNYYNPIVKGSKDYKDSKDSQIHFDLEPEKNISLNDLSQFFIDPLDYFLKNRAQISHPIYETILNDTETYFPTGLETWQLKNEIFKHGKTVAAKTGIVSDNKSGQFVLDKYSDDLEPVLRLSETLDLKKHVIEHSIEDYKIFGYIQIDDKQQHISIYPNKASAKNICKHWIQHLCYQSVLPEQPSYAYFEDKKIQFAVLDNAQELLLHILLKWQRSYNCPWLFCAKSALKILKTGIYTHNRKDYLKQFIQTDRVFPSEGQKYFIHLVEKHQEQVDFDEFILPIIMCMESLQPG
ncbi:MAG: exodeoxyribonuclease V subunit gamma [Proteobacteria bacterium]|nr:exodeoxyribonuclease V subunit gamma [Pseudomonadota bacterium]